MWWNWAILISFSGHRHCIKVGMLWRIQCWKSWGCYQYDTWFKGAEIRIFYQNFRVGVSQSRASWNGGSNFGAPQVHFNISIAEWDLNLICRCVGQFTLTVAWPSLMRHSQFKLGGNNKLRACRCSLSAGRGGQLSQVPVWGRERKAILTTSRLLASRILVVRRVWMARSTLVLTILWVSPMRDSTFASSYFSFRLLVHWLGQLHLWFLERGHSIFEEGYRGLAGTTVAFGKFSTKTCLIY